jgi:2-polyprenyl-3-methyl-5-hydroxy-6-metoxy-1,4-benzoquinol methylase
MKFDKYAKHNAYHWRQYVRGDKYRRHADFIKSWVKEKNILDVGAGDGLITYLLGATGLEYEQTAVDIAQTIGVNVIQGDAYALPYEKDSFDAVTMLDVLEHFDTPELALQEARRIAPVLYISTPEIGMVNDPFHVQEWTRESLPMFLKENGWNLDGVVLVVPENKTMYAKFFR